MKYYLGDRFKIIALNKTEYTVVLVRISVREMFLLAESTSNRWSDRPMTIHLNGSYITRGQLLKSAGGCIKSIRKIRNKQK